MLTGHLHGEACDKVLLLSCEQAMYWSELDEAVRAQLGQQVAVHPGHTADHRAGAAAEQRQLLAPLKKAAEKLEKELNKVSDLNAEVENALADSSLYEAASKDRLKELLNRQAEYRQQIAQLEEDWLMAQEELETLQQELGNS